MHNQSNSNSVSYKVYLLLAGSACSILVLVYLGNWVAVLSSPYSINFEGPMLWAADALAKGQNIYPAAGLNSEPWISTIYPPLYLVFCAFLVKIFGAQYFALRASSMIFGLVTAWLFYRIGKMAKLALPAIFCGLVFYFSFGAVSLRCFEVRPDIMQIFLCVFMLERFLSIYLVSPDSSLKKYWSVLLLGFLAICVKQQAIVFLLALILFLCLGGKAKLAFKIFAVWVLSLLSFSAIMQFCSGAYLENLSFLSVVKPSAQVFVSNLGSLGVDWIKLSVVLLLVPIGVLALKKLQGVDSLPFILVFVSTALLFYSMGIPASSASHMMSGLLGLAWCLSLCLNRLPHWLGITSLVASLSSLPFLAEEAIYGPQLLSYARKDAKILESLDIKGKPVLTDDVYLNMLTGSLPVLVDCATFLNVWTAQESNFNQLIEPLKKKRYAAVIINSNDSQLASPLIWWPSSVVKAVHANYHRTNELHCSGWSMDLYLPNQDIEAKSMSPGK